MPAWWQKQGYISAIQLNPDLWIVMDEMVFTIRLRACNEMKIFADVDYPKDKGFAFAAEVLISWDGVSLPPEGFTRYQNHETGEEIRPMNSVTTE